MSTSYFVAYNAQKEAWGIFRIGAEVARSWWPDIRRALREVGRLDEEDKPARARETIVLGE